MILVCIEWGRARSGEVPYVGAVLSKNLQKIRKLQEGIKKLHSGSRRVRNRFITKTLEISI